MEIVADKQLTRALLELVPLDDSGGCWLLGLEMEKPGNLSGIEYAPADRTDEMSGAQSAPASAPEQKKGKVRTARPAATNFAGRSSHRTRLISRRA